MNIRDEGDLRARLTVALDDVVPGPLPLGSVVRQGRTMKTRRRVAAAMGAAVIAAAAIATPVLLHGSSQRPVGPTTPAHNHGTVYPPGPGSQRDLIAYGRVDGRTWRVTGTLNTNIPVMPYLCIHVVMSAVSPGGHCQRGQPPLASQHGDPADLSPISLNSAKLPALRIVAGSVRADVGYLRVSLSNGEVLTLRPVAVFGAKYERYVAFAVPRAPAVLQIRAYSRRGELAYAVPFTADGSITIGRWIGAGQPAQPSPATYVLGSGELNGAHWAIDLYVGPWGSCFSWRVASWCWPVVPSSLAGSHIVEAFEFGFPLGPTPDYVSAAVMATAPSVRYVVVHRSYGRGTSRLRITEAAGARFAVFVAARGFTFAHWIAYSAAGARLASGQL
jgi:hypothetical protein